MLSRRIFFKKWLLAPVLGFAIHFINPFKSVPNLWAKTKKILPKGFPKNQIINMNPAEVDSRNLEIDSLNKFGTMGPTDVVIDLKTYRLKIKGKLERPLSLTYDQILKYPSITETVLLICPGFFVNHGRWTGINLRELLQEVQVKKGAKYIDIKGAHKKGIRIPLSDVSQKKIFLAYRVNGEPLPQKHGFPLRLVFEDAYGYDWVKYIYEVVIS